MPAASVTAAAKRANRPNFIGTPKVSGREGKRALRNRAIREPEAKRTLNTLYSTALALLALSTVRAGREGKGDFAPVWRTALWLR